ncbi:acyl carrier protein [Flexivirga oryzae]|uniref:Acyl carrier protein n=1 Tax=Flexivirga oryzae TaxID=1794944 RepID=A0A839N7J5_9MICO|nr:acyl carrier protein [Flexivirga oryzae]MBB2893237.1 acyl carrier protein [Flexivirga oryzae]
MTVTTTTSGKRSTQDVSNWLVGWIHRHLGIPAESFGIACDLRDLAMDSTESLLLLEDIRSEFGVRLRPIALVNSSVWRLAGLVAERP